MIKERALSSRHDQSIEYAMSVLLGDYSDYLQEIRLFGSCARGQQRYRSDVDLLIVVSEGTPPRIMRQMRAAATPEDDTLPAVDLKFSTGPEYSTSAQFNRNIMEEGRTLWTKV